MKSNPNVIYHFLLWQNGRKNQEHKTSEATKCYNKARAMQIPKQHIKQFVAEKKHDAYEYKKMFGRYGNKASDYESWCEWLNEYEQWALRQ